MQNKNTKTAKTQNVSVKKENAVKTVTSLNLAKFADKLKNVELKEKNKKETIYIYPENFTQKMISETEGKQHRNKIRNQMKRFVNNIQLFAKFNRIDDLKKEINSFDEFYKKNFRITDYSFASISNTKNEAKEADLKLMLEIINEVRNAKK